MSETEYDSSGKSNSSFQVSENFKFIVVLHRLNVFLCVINA